MAQPDNDNINRSTRYQEIAERHGDPWIWGIYFTLLVISVVESYSASSREIAAQGIYMPLVKQCFFLALGALAVFVLHRVDYNRPSFLYLMIPGFAMLTIFCLVFVLIAGKEINGAQRAIIVGPISIQPAEMAKLSIVMVLAYILAKNQKNHDVSMTGLVLSATAVTVFGSLMIKSGLTNTLLLMIISMSMLLIGGARLKKIVYIILVYIVVGGSLYMVKSSNDRKVNLVTEAVADTDDADDSDEKGPALGLSRAGTWKNRISDWWNSDSLVYRPLTNKNQQEMFSRMAQAHGGIIGVGLGNSRECSRLPLAFSDYIYSIIIEETGLVGGLIILVLYLWLLARAAMIVRRSRRVLPSLLVIGMASLITYQALFHMAINVGVFPVSGQPLPLISKGGSATLMMSVAFGIMLSVSRTIANNNNRNNPVDTAPLPAGLDAENPTQIQPKNVWK